MVNVSEYFNIRLSSNDAECTENLTLDHINYC